MISLPSLSKQRASHLAISNFAIEILGLASMIQNPIYSFGPCSLNKSSEGLLFNLNVTANSKTGYHHKYVHLILSISLSASIRAPSLSIERAPHNRYVARISKALQREALVDVNRFGVSLGWIMLGRALTTILARGSISQPFPLFRFSRRVHLSFASTCSRSASIYVATWSKRVFATLVLYRTSRS